MTVKTTVTSLPRRVLGGYLRAGRVPLTVAERVTGQRSNEKWRPTMAYEALQAGIEERVGTLIRDETLVAKGRTRKAKLAELTRAINLETVAEQERERANEEFQARRREAEAQKADAARKAEQRERELERQAQIREEKARAKAAKKAATVQEAKAAQDKSIDRRERAAKSAALAKEAEAVKSTKQALEAERTVDVIAETLEGEKEARKTG
jgi:hypothetical protein